MAERKRFTEEEQRELAASPYVARVSATTIAFTPEFKQLFYERSKAGMSGPEICCSLGVSPEILGEYRIRGLALSVKKMAQRQEGFQDQRFTANRSKPRTFRQPRFNEIMDGLEARIQVLEEKLKVSQEADASKESNPA